MSFKWCDLKVSKKLAVLVGSAVLGIAAYGVVTFGTVATVKVNGPLYDDVVAMKDLVADVQHPPAYIVGSGSDAMMTVDGSSSMKPLSEE